MFCNKCGNQIEDSARFCKICGASVDGGQGNIQPEPQPEFYQSENNIPAVSPVVERIKRVASSGMMLGANILNSIGTAGALITALLSGTIFNILIQLMSEELTGSEFLEFERIMSGMSGVYTGAMFVALIPAVLTTVALWMIYAAGKDLSTPTMKTGGITILRVLTVIGLVGMCVSAGIMLLSFVFTFIGISSASSIGLIGGPDAAVTGAATAVLVVMFIIMALVFTLSILVLVKTLSTLKAAKNTVETGTVQGKASMLLAVYMIVIGALNCLNFPLGLIQGIAYILFGILITKLKEAMEINENPYNPNMSYQPYQNTQIPNSNM